MKNHFFDVAKEIIGNNVVTSCVRKMIESKFNLRDEQEEIETDDLVKNFILI